jgi:ATP-binding protein involved in chromosome partitioning
MFGKKTPALTERDVLEALKGVKDPDLHRDLVDLGMIKDIRIGDDRVTLTVNLTTPACPLKAKIESDVREALTARLGTELAYHVNMTADVRGKGVSEKGDIPGVKNVIAVGSGKGGVGKSTMAAAIAYGLKSYGAAVGIMDADVYGPSIPHLVGATGRPMAKGDRIQPIEANGLKLMSMGFLLEPERAVIMRGPMLHGIMQQFLHQVEWGELDYLVIDLPPGTGDVPLTLAQALPLTGAVVICTPQEVALLDAVRALTMFRQLKVPILGMVENMSFFDVKAYLQDRGGDRARTILEEPGLFKEPGDERVYLFGRGGARRKAEELGVPFLGEVPLNICLREVGDEGRIDRSFSDDSASRPYLLALVEQLASQISIQNIKAPKMPKLEIINL